MKDVTSAQNAKTHKIEDIIVENKKTILTVLALIVLGGVGYSGWSYMAEQKEMDAQVELFKADLAYEKTIEEAQKIADEKKQAEVAKTLPSKKNSETPAVKADPVKTETLAFHNKAPF